MPPNPSDDLPKLAGRRANHGQLALRPLRMVATSPSIGAGRSALRHPGRDRSLGCAHAGTVAQRPRYPPIVTYPQSDFAIVIEIIDCAAPIRSLPIFLAARKAGLDPSRKPSWPRPLSGVDLPPDRWP